MKRYVFNNLIALDQFGNALAGGDPQETVSSRAAKAQRKGRRWGICLCALLNLFQRGHCEKSLNPDEGADAVIPD